MLYFPAHDPQDEYNIWWDDTLFDVSFNLSLIIKLLLGFFYQYDDVATFKVRN